MYDVIKYPASTSHSFSSYNYDSEYSKYGYLLSKEITSANAVMLIPKGMGGYDSTEKGIHFSVQMVQKKNSNSGWGDAIALVNSKELTHYRDNKILELGAYNTKKGIKYSNTNETVTVYDFLSLLNSFTVTPSILKSVKNASVDASSLVTVAV